MSCVFLSPYLNLVLKGYHLWGTWVTSVHMLEKWPDILNQATQTKKSILGSSCKPSPTSMVPEKNETVGKKHNQPEDPDKGHKLKSSNNKVHLYTQSFAGVLTSLHSLN